MYEYTIKFGTSKKKILSNNLYNLDDFNMLISELINALEKSHSNIFDYSENKFLSLIYDELINNHNFIEEINNDIVCNIQRLLPNNLNDEKKTKENIKQVLVVRADLLNPIEDYVGKMMAQVGHASSGGILNLMSVEKISDNKEVRTLEIVKDSDLDLWINGMFRKITVYVNSEEELFKVHKKALKKGLNSVLIEDAGLTCFEPGTYTCCAIGPAPFKSFNGVTNHLPIHI